MKTDSLYIQIRRDGGPLLVEATVFVSGKPTTETEYDMYFVVETPSQEAALSDPRLAGRRVAVIRPAAIAAGIPL